MKALIDIAKNIRKHAFLKRKYSGDYAFVGIGNHSIHNLYPVLDYLGVSLKYIVTKSEKNALAVTENFTPVKGTVNYDEVLNDQAIKGVFICASPASHFNLAKKALEKGKNVFVEKPVCSNINELKQLQNLEKHGAFCLAGMQKRYAPSYTILKKKMKDPLYYTFKYVTGAYPEGDAILDLFIHALDITMFLFGGSETVSVKKVVNTKNNAITYLIQMTHKNQVTGMLELSTDYAWSFAEERLLVNTTDGFFTSENSENLRWHNKPSTFMNIPVEKIKGFSSQVTTLFERNGFLPVKDHNQLYSSGYFGEISKFLDICEGKSGKETNASSLYQIEDTYKLIEQIRSHVLISK